jgi:hypothetical protein
MRSADPAPEQIRTIVDQLGTAGAASDFFAYGFAGGWGVHSGMRYDFNLDRKLTLASPAAAPNNAPPVRSQRP